MDSCIYGCMCMCVLMYTCACGHMHAYIYIYKYSPRHTIVTLFPRQNRYIRLPVFLLNVLLIIEVHPFHSCNSFMHVRGITLLSCRSTCCAHSSPPTHSPPPTHYTHSRTIGETSSSPRKRLVNWPSAWQWESRWLAASSR
jgi:hypothetical protein